MSIISKISKLKISPFLHFCVWVMFLVSPLFVFPNRDNLDKIFFFRHIVTTLSLMTIFYLNYILFVKKYFFRDKLKHFALCNIISISILCGINFICNEITNPYIDMERQERINKEREEISKYMRENNCGELEAIIKTGKEKSKKENAGKMWKVLINAFIYICFMGTAIALITMKNLYLNEEKRKETEKKQVEAELKNLKSQLNPHFLFNTLNNIYALIAISQEKSQEAVMELSKMLRYVLYEADAKEVLLSKEIVFINNYIDLMRLRLSSKTEITTDINVNENPNVTVAPLLFISLIENAFKHGVSSQHDSFIHFSLQTTKDNQIICRVENSYFPKTTEQDKSGSGIGTENTKRRLELLYPNQHNYKYWISDQNTFVSEITINNISNAIQA